MYPNSYDLLMQSQSRVEQYHSEAKWQRLIKTALSCHKQNKHAVQIRKAFVYKPQARRLLKLKHQNSALVK